MFSNFDNIWFYTIYSEFKQPYFKALFKFLSSERKKKIIYPQIKDMLTAFRETNFKNVNVVIIGQDPYCEENQAHGLAFSVKDYINLPPSLNNIYKELNNDLGINVKKKSGNLKYIAKQGILLLNTVLTVEKNKPGSHINVGWENITDKIIKILSNKKKKIIFVLLGKNAENKIKLININNNVIIESSHPSSKSAHKSFAGSRIFSKINLHLKLLGKNTINW